jgi:phytanoyl-CoA hydroxylase
MSASDRKPVTAFCPDQLEQADIDQFHQQGYLAFEEVLSSAEVEEAREAVSAIARDLMARAQAGQARIEGGLKDATRNYAGTQVVDPESSFGIHFEEGIDPLSVSPEEAETKYRKLTGYHQEDPALVALVQQPRIKGFVEQLLGEEAIMQADMALCKPPFIGSEKPWHQDNAYFNFLPLEKRATAWVALDDATIENGCMHMLPGSYTPLRHHHTTDCEIVADRIDKSQAVPVELRAGGVIYFTAMIPHQTPPNRTPHRRRALQFQFRGISTREVSRQEFGKVFAEADGAPATCALAYENG